MREKFGIKKFLPYTSEKILKKTEENIVIRNLIIEKSIAILKDENKILPLKAMMKNDLVLVVRSKYEKIARADSSWKELFTLPKYIKQYHDNVKSLIVDNIEDLDEKFIECAKIIIIGSYNANLPSLDKKYKQVEMVKYFKNFGKTIVVVGMGDPRELDEFLDVDAYIAAYNVYDYSMEKVARMIFGK